MIVAFTGAGISKASGIPTFEEKGDMREKLDRTYYRMHPKEVEDILSEMEQVCAKAEPNDAHSALAEYGVPVLTMNIDRLHERAGSSFVVPMHGVLPDKVVLYGDPAPNYRLAYAVVDKLGPGDILLIVGVSFYTSVSDHLRAIARGNGASVFVINESAETNVRAYLNNHKGDIGDVPAFIASLQSEDTFFC